MRFDFTSALLLASLLLGPAPVLGKSKSKSTAKDATVQKLLAVPGATIERGLPVGSGQLVHYLSNNVSFAKATRALIVVHGLPRDGDKTFISGQAAVHAAAAAGLVKADEVAIAAPQFFNGDDKGKFPVDEESDAPTSDQLVWKGNDWMNGAGSQFPGTAANVSTFAALDALVAFFANTTAFPKMKAITLAGHSGGGQLVQRYALMGADAPKGIAMRYLVANPSSFAYLTEDRPVPNKKGCKGFNDWKFGLDKYPADQYGAEKLATASAKQALLARYVQLPISHLYSGAADKEGTPLDTSCAAETQGATHGARSANWLSYLRAQFPAQQRFQYAVAVPGVRHNATGIFVSALGQQALFGSLGTLVDATDAALFRALPASSRRAAKKSKPSSKSGGYTVALNFTFPTRAAGFQVAMTLPPGHTVGAVRGARLAGTDAVQNGTNALLMSTVRAKDAAGSIEFDVHTDEGADAGRVSSFQIVGM